jgi:UDP-N-acetylglucosamine/UDP-N-acetylgalactosamine diphosphorylase
MAPNGNGGIFKALEDEKILEIMAENNIEYLYITNVDNILTNPYDETILGNLIDTKTQLGVKTLLKKDANEKVGVCCKKDGKFAIVEYIDLPKELCEKKMDDGTLLFKDSYFGTCYLSLELLRKIADEKLPYHRAKKKNEYIDKNGNKVLADDVNSIKSEMFIFDGFYKADSVKLYRVRREEEFAPIKGKEDIIEAVRLYNNSNNQKNK